MKPETLMTHFENLAERVGVKIIRGKGNFHGGSCLVQKKDIIVLNTVKPIEQRLRVLAQDFIQRDLSDVYLVPALRAYIEEMQDTLFSYETTKVID